MYCKLVSSGERITDTKLFNTTFRSGVIGNGPVTMEKNNFSYLALLAPNDIRLRPYLGLDGFAFTLEVQPDDCLKTISACHNLAPVGRSIRNEDIELITFVLRDLYEACLRNMHREYIRTPHQMNTLKTLVNLFEDRRTIIMAPAPAFKGAALHNAVFNTGVISYACIHLRNNVLEIHIPDSKSRSNMPDYSTTYRFGVTKDNTIYPMDNISSAAMENGSIAKALSKLYNYRLSLRYLDYITPEVFIRFRTIVGLFVPEVLTTR